MLRLAANLTMMFNEVPFLDRFDAAVKAGFSAVEFISPIEFPLGEVRRRANDAGVRIVLFNIGVGNWAAGDRGLGAIRGRQTEFRDDVMRALEYADAVDCSLLHCMAGIPEPGTSRTTAEAVFASNLAWAVERTVPDKKRIVLEPINHRDIPGYHLNTIEQARSLIDAFGVDRIGLQFDLYHTQVTEGDLTKRLEVMMPFIAHMQIADVPMRNEPGTGEIAWEYIFGRIQALGYEGWIGCEYRPAGETVAGLTWRVKYGI